MNMGSAIQQYKSRQKIFSKFYDLLNLISILLKSQPCKISSLFDYAKFVDAKFVDFNCPGV